MHFDPPHTYFMASAEHHLRVRDAHGRSTLSAGRKTRRTRRRRHSH